jgi:hypothetical protein
MDRKKQTRDTGRDSRVERLEQPRPIRRVSVPSNSEAIQMAICSPGGFILVPIESAPLLYR